ncbi:MAG TPA: Spy/CpxP family protein refolding chaperone [Tepidisphaeraceae bacterium]|nr:Spy/CpxP family protein refolding chaperone [Tepidisphaeraceae bacterium]
MIRAKYVLILAFLLVCAAGASVGVVVDRQVHAPRPRENPKRGFAGMLNLTPEQQEKMKSIWSKVEQVRNQTFHERHDIEQQRESDVVSLLSKEQKEQYDQIQQRHRQQVEALKTEMGQAVHEAEQETRAMLNPEQQKKYDEFRARMGPPHGPGPFPRGPRRHDMNRQPGRPTTAPSVG